MAAGAGAEAADADAPGPSACPSRRASPAKAPKPARAAAPAAAAASKSAEKRPRAGAATGKTAKQAAATAQQVCPYCKLEFPENAALHSILARLMVLHQTSIGPACMKPHSASVARTVNTFDNFPPESPMPSIAV